MTEYLLGFLHAAILFLLGILAFTSSGPAQPLLMTVFVVFIVVTLIIWFIFLLENL